MVTERYICTILSASPIANLSFGIAMKLMPSEYSPLLLNIHMKVQSAPSMLHGEAFTYSNRPGAEFSHLWYQFMPGEFDIGGKWMSFYVYFI